MKTDKHLYISAKSCQIVKGAFAWLPLFPARFITRNELLLWALPLAADLSQVTGNVNKLVRLTHRSMENSHRNSKSWDLSSHEEHIRCLSRL